MNLKSISLKTALSVGFVVYIFDAEFPRIVAPFFSSRYLFQTPQNLFTNTRFWPNERVFFLCCHVFPSLLNILIVKGTTQANHVFCFEVHTAQGHWGGPLVVGQPIVCCPSKATPTSWWFVGRVSGSTVLCGDLSREAGPASAIVGVSSLATTRRECGSLAFVEFKVASFQLGSEIPFQPLEWPGNLEPRGPWRYNDAWHNSTTVSPDRFPGNHTTCAIVRSALLPSHVTQLYPDKPRGLSVRWSST